MDSEIDVKKSHRKRKAGPKHDKKVNKEKGEVPSSLTAKQRNPKAFAVRSVNKVRREVHRTADKIERKVHIPTVDSSFSKVEPSPFVVAVVGPAKVGKTTLISNFVKHFTKQKMTKITGPVTVVAGKKRRITFIECPNDLSAMIDIGKIADLALLLVDASFGFEMETFEFLNILQVHGFPKIMGVLNHLDVFKNDKKLKSAKRKLKHRFWSEVVQGSKLFYLSGFQNDDYLPRDVKNLARFLTVMKFRPINWRLNHPYVFADRIEDISDPAEVDKNPKIDRNISVYGYVRGCNLRPHSHVHIPGVGDFQIRQVDALPDPCPTAQAVRDAEASGKRLRRTLNEKERLLYAPFSGFAGIVYDKDAVYIELGGSHSFDKSNSKGDESVSKISPLSSMPELPLLPGVNLEHNNEENMNDKRVRRRAIFENGDDEESGNEDGDVEAISKNELLERAHRDFFKYQSTAHKLDSSIYGKSEDKGEGGKGEVSDDDEIGGLFKLADVSRSKSDTFYNSLNKEDSNRDLRGKISGLDTKDHVPKSLLNLFVTGQWDESEDAAARLNADDEIRRQLKESPDSLGDGFIDLENQENNDEDVGSADESVDATDDYMKKKLAKKKQFDAEFDATGGKMNMNSELPEEEDEKADRRPEMKFYEDWKAQLDEQANVNRDAFSALTEDERNRLEGFRPGTYVRMEFTQIPSEFIRNFDPAYPVIAGGLATSDEPMGCVQCRFKKHRWAKKILKTRDPIIVSIGWRRYQTTPVYTMQDHNLRNRLIKYTPENTHCWATFWGPIAPQNTGVLAVQSLSSSNVCVFLDFVIKFIFILFSLNFGVQLQEASLKLTLTSAL